MKSVPLTDVVRNIALVAIVRYEKHWGHGYSYRGKGPFAGYSDWWEVRQSTERRPGYQCDDDPPGKGATGGTGGECSPLL
jgi:hypothetical protein